VEPVNALDRACFDTANREGRDAFFRRPASVSVARAEAAAFEFSFKLR
jgi:hypothetical protein